MELKIYCDASVKLEKMSNVMEVECNVGDYRVEGDSLTGDIIIQGNYIKDVLEELYEFSEVVPFTIVFNDKDYDIKEISVQDFSCQEIINHGIECNFNIVVNYLDEFEDVELLDGHTKEEIEMELEEIEEEIEDELEFDEVIEIENEEIEELIEELKEDDEILNASDEDIKNEIGKKYDNLLNEILEARADQNFLEKNENIAVRSTDINKDCRGILSNMQDSMYSYRVYYTTKESDIEAIAKKEKISLDRVYKENKNNDFINKKRIIIK